MSPSLRQQALRRIPKVDDLLSRPEVVDLLRLHPRPVVVDAIRRALERLRGEILGMEASSQVDDALFSIERLVLHLNREIDLHVRPRLRRVINATGVIIHTNLGRSPLHPSALEHMIETAKAYSNLEYDLVRGERGSRYSHVEDLLCRRTGAESALVVNNNAAAVLLAINTMAEGRETIVSRGELVEIGGAFRIPDVMKRSGALLREVGTTNRTHLSDYEKAIGPQTALLLKVHTSNFRVIGFTSEVSIQELVQLGRRHGLPVLNDLGSGCLIDLTQYGLEKEPTVQEVLESGADLVTFSGDKLLGGPQAGMIVGKKEYLDRIKVNPLTRALRIDKLTLSALESTLLLYLDEAKAMKEIPTLRMMTLDRKTLRSRGRRLLRRLPADLKEKATITLRDDVSQVGGGSLPLQELPTIVLSVRPLKGSAKDLEARLRRGDPPVIGRISKDELILDLRTLFDEEIPWVAGALVDGLAGLEASP